MLNRDKTCRVDGCCNPVRAKDLCNKHRQRLANHRHTDRRNRYRMHGFSDHPLAKTLMNMFARCRYANRHNASAYEGVSVCEEWHSTETFVRWGIANGWRPGLVIDRIDPDGDYEPDNCRFITHDENSRRARKHELRYFAFDRCEPLSVWSAMSGVKYQTLWARINRYSYLLERALLA